MSATTTATLTPSGPEVKGRTAGAERRASPGASANPYESGPRSQPEGNLKPRRRDSRNMRTRPVKRLLSRQDAQKVRGALSSARNHLHHHGEHHAPLPPGSQVWFTGRFQAIFIARRAAQIAELS